MKRKFALIDLAMLPIVCACVAVAFGVWAAVFVAVAYGHGFWTGSAR